MAGNRLTHLPEELGQLNQLRNFQAAGNLLEKLPNSFTQLTNLEASQVTHLSSLCGSIAIQIHKNVNAWSQLSSPSSGEITSINQVIKLGA